MVEDARIGTTVGSYRLLSQIGRGGMSIVYLAVDLRTGNEVAVKLLSPELADNEEFRERFLRESRITPSFEHPNIVPVYEAGEEDGHLHIAMRYVEGKHLGELIHEERRLGPELTAGILERVAEALDAAHGRGLVHRDVKPGNILLGAAANEVFLGDFGLTKKALSASGFTATGQMVGTIDYVAPEQIRGDPVDGRADVYSLGCVLFECLTGHVPFPRDREVATLWAHISESPPKITAERDDVSLGVDQVVARAMAKDPVDRYPAATELTEDLRSELAAVGARPRRRAFRTSKQRRRTRRVVIATVVAVLAITATVVYVATRPPPLVVPQANSLSRLDPEGRRFVESRSVLEQPIELAVGAETVWTINQGRNTVQRVDPDDLEAEPVTVGVQGSPTGLAVGEESAWVTTGFTTGERGTGLYQMNPATNQLTLWTEVPPGSQAVAVGGGFVWVASSSQDRVLRLDPVTTSRDVVRLEAGSEPIALTLGVGEAEGIWTANALGSSVSRISFDGTLVATYGVPSPPDAVAVVAGAVWVASEISDAVYRLNPKNGALLATVAVPDGPVALAVTADSVWVCAGNAGVVARIEPSTSSVTDRLRVDGVPISIVGDARGDVWIGVGPR